MIYRRERKDMPAIAEEVEAAEEEGVRFIFLASPHRIVGERAPSRPSRSSRRGWANSTRPDAGARSTPTKCTSSPAPASSWRSAKASTPISPAPPV